MATVIIGGGGALPVPLPVTDQSPPLSALSHGGVDVAAGAEVTLIAGLAGRVKVEMYHAGTTGTVQLAFGQTAEAGKGVPLGPGQGWSEFTDQAVHVLNTSSAAIRLTWVEWGT